MRKNSIRTRWILFLLSLTLLLLLACCSRDTGYSAQRSDELPYEIVIENQTLGEEMEDLAAVEEAVNAITLPAINCTVKIKNIYIGEHQSVIRLMNLRNEKIDLINTGRTDPLFDMVNDHLLIPLDDLLQNYGQTILEDKRALLEACRINGQLYAVPAAPYNSSMMGFVYNAEIAEKLGISISDYPSITDIESVAQKLKANNLFLLNPDIQISGFGLFSALFPEAFSVTGNFTYGILTEENGKYSVKNIFESPEFMDYCLLMKKWSENGWIPSDFLVSGLNVSEQFRQGKSFMTWSDTSPVELALQAGDYPFRIGMFTTNRSGVSTHTILENGWGISTSSKNPQKAMEFLNFVYENEKVANLLMYGIEGREYKKISQHIIAFPDGQIAADLKYKRDFSVFGDFQKLYEWYPMTEDDYEAVQNYYEELYLSDLFGYSFDSTSVSAAVSAVSAVLDDYLPALKCGMLSDVSSAVASLNEKLSEAGIDQILSENQNQLDIWLEQRGN